MAAIEGRRPAERRARAGRGTLIVDGRQVTLFVDALFRYASPGQTVSLRSFMEGATSPYRIQAAALDVADLRPLVEAAVREAQLAAGFRQPTVFCPPIAAFRNEKEPWRTRERDLYEAFALSVECDASPGKARDRLEHLLGPATMIVASGGEWIDPATGESEPKLHLHWRVNEPASGADLHKLKEARRMAAMVAGGDRSNVPIVHPIRWPGTWHRKAEPRMARIVQAEPDRQIGLVEALEVLRAAASTTEDTPAGPGDTAAASRTETRVGDDRTTADLIANISSGREYHPALVSLAARLLGRGMYAGAVVEFLRELMNAAPPKGRNPRWMARYDSIPRIVDTAVAKWGVNQEQPQGAATAPPPDPVDLWARYDPPVLPSGLLPPIIEEFARLQAALMGADPGGLAAAMLAVCAAAIPDRIELQVKQHDAGWRECARLWVALIGLPSTKKSPILSAAAKPLIRLDGERWRTYAAAMAEFQKLNAEERKSKSPPKQLRLRIEDTTIEAAQEVLKDSPNGLLCLQDELAGWFGSMDKYSGSRGAAKDRSFWLQSFNGGPYAVNRIA